MTSEANNATIRGLTRDQALARLRADGPNELPSAKPRSFLAIAWEVLREPMILLLVAAGAIYLILGEPRDSHRPADFDLCDSRDRPVSTEQDGARAGGAA